MRESNYVTATRFRNRGPVKYWEIIADRLSASGWSWGMTTVIGTNADKLFIVDAHRADPRGRFIVRSDELLTAFLELEQDTKNVGP